MEYEGTLISGTLRPEDLLPAFYKCLQDLAPLTAKVRAEGTYAEEIRHALNGTLTEYIEAHEDHSEYVAWAIESIEDDLAANAPDGYYFGTLEGDGSDFGFWPDNGMF